MGAPTGLLATMVLTLLCSCAPVHRAERCSGFRHLENGRTFFRYGGLLVIFHCDPGYKLHGYRTNSCVSGHWSRELPACVGSACPSPGPLVHGTSSVNEDVSWAMFSCDSGFKLQGPSMLYCKGHAWNGSKPFCKESDMMMSSASRTAVQKPHLQQNRHNAQAPVVVNHQQGHSLYDTLIKPPSKEAYLKFNGSSSNIPLQIPNGEGSKMSSHELHLKEWVQYTKAEIPLKEAARLLHPGVHIQREIETNSGAGEGSVKASSVLPDRGTVKNDSVADHSLEDMEKGNRGTESFPMPLTPATQVTTESEPSPTLSPAPSSRILTSAPIAVTNGPSERAPAADTVVSIQTQVSTSVLLVLGGENVSSSQSQDHVSPTALVNYLFLDERSTQAGPVVDSGQDGQAGSEGVKLLLGTRPLDLIQSTTEPPIKHQPNGMQQTQGPYTGSTTPSTSPTASISPQTFTSSSSLTPSLSSAYSAPTSNSAFTTIGRTSTRSNANVTPPSQTTVDQRPPHQIEFPNLRNNVTVNPLTLSLSRGRRPVCPYPPVPAHGTFYFRNVVNPGPTEYKHYIQYACYPGYTLANGDIHSYCHRGGAWSGVTPVCLELTPCSVNNGGCSQVCLHDRSHNQSHSESETSIWCHCRSGFTLLEDKRTCRDLDECVEGRHQCHQKCVNTFGSFKCSCDEGYQLAHDHTSCIDVDECLLPAAVTGCMFGCVNTPGRFYCQCPAGYSLHTTDGHCQDIDECAVKEGTGPCEELCHNSPGSYSCSCAYGYALAGNGHGCVPQCSPGYRKQALTSRLDNSTTHRPREECVDIDECQEVELQVNKCEWQCVNLPGSHRCICPKGYSLQADGAHCKDINECNRKNGGCSHLCLNYRGGYKCACPASHRLSPYSRKKCLPRKTEDTAG